MAFDAAADQEGPPRISANPLGTQALGIKVQSLEKGVQHIRENCAKFGTPTDTTIFRKKVVGQIQKAVGLTEEIELGLRRAGAAASGARDEALQRGVAQLQSRYRTVKGALVDSVRQSQTLQHQYDPVDIHTHVNSQATGASNGEVPLGSPQESGRGGRRKQEQRQLQEEVSIELRGFGAVDAAIIEVRMCGKALHGQPEDSSQPSFIQHGAGAQCRGSGHSRRGSGAARHVPRPRRSRAGAEQAARRRGDAGRRGAHGREGRQL